MANTVEVWLEVDGSNHRALIIPLETCMDFALFPLTWLCYLGFTICGSEGHISTTPNGQALDYRPKDPVIQTGNYYFIAGEQPRWLDFDMMNDRTSYTSDSPRTARQADFRQDLIDRDGTCVITGENPPSCQACHIIPHSRGDEYINNPAEYRERSSFDGINDERNGLLLYIALHRPFGESQIAFLRTPNHAMEVTDVAYVVQPNAVDIGPDATRRFTVQHFEKIDRIMSTFAPHNSDARIPNNDELWPSDMVFDASYGCAALKRWGDPAFINLIRDRIANINRGRGGDGDEDPHGTNARAARVANRARAREQATNAHTEDDYADVVFALWMQNATKRQRQSEAKKAERARDNVQHWLDSPQNQV